MINKIKNYLKQKFCDHDFTSPEILIADVYPYSYRVTENVICSKCDKYRCAKYIDSDSKVTVRQGSTSLYFKTDYGKDLSKYKCKVPNERN